MAQPEPDVRVMPQERLSQQQLKALPIQRFQFFYISISMEKILSKILKKSCVRAEN